MDSEGKHSHQKRQDRGHDHGHDHGHEHSHEHDHGHSHVNDWRHHGVQVVRADEFDPNTPQTEGMSRAAAICRSTTDAQKIWAGTVSILPNAKTGAHHHGSLESVIYVIKGKARMRWGARLEFTAEAGPGDFIFVPPFVPHQEINASTDEPLECVIMRSDQEAVVVNLEIAAVEKPESVHWVDVIHRAPKAGSQVAPQKNPPKRSARSSR